MNKQEILQASLLDILFDGRNKEYGAYALRRGYNHRLITALVAGSSALLLFVLLSQWNGSGSGPSSPPSKPEIAITTVSLPPEEKKKDPEPVKKEKPGPKPPAAQPRPAEPVATVKYPPVIVAPDDQVTTALPSVDEIGDKQIGTSNTPGRPFDGAGTGTGDRPATANAGEAVPEENKFMPSHSDPEYPGGQKALQEFLARNLYTPEDLETGDKKMVKARFVVDRDGSISEVRIELSGGNMFDKEVIRVCKKMPKWKPAVQNGHPVAVSYVLPVTFIGAEQ